MPCQRKSDASRQKSSIPRASVHPFASRMLPRCSRAPDGRRPAGASAEAKIPDHSPPFLTGVAEGFPSGHIAEENSRSDTPPGRQWREPPSGRQWREPPSGRQWREPPSGRPESVRSGSDDRSATCSAYLRIPSPIPVSQIPAQQAMTCSYRKWS